MSNRILEQVRVTSSETKIGDTRQLDTGISQSSQQQVPWVSLGYFLRPSWVLLWFSLGQTMGRFRDKKLSAWNPQRRLSGLSRSFLGVLLGASGAGVDFLWDFLGQDWGMLSLPDAHQKRNGETPNALFKQQVSNKV